MSTGPEFIFRDPIRPDRPFTSKTVTRPEPINSWWR